MLLILNIPMIGLWVRLLQIPYRYLCPVIVCMICIGAYTINNSTFDVVLVLVFGVIGYGMRLVDLHPAPLLIGFVLSPLIEPNFRRALLISDGDYTIFVSRSEERRVGKEWG